MKTLLIFLLLCSCAEDRTVSKSENLTEREEIILRQNTYSICNNANRTVYRKVEETSEYTRYIIQTIKNGCNDDTNEIIKEVDILILKNE